MGDPEITQSGRGGHAFIIIAAFVIVAAGMREASEIIVPFLAAIFEEGGMDPTVVVGGKLNSVGTNAVLGRGECGRPNVR